MQDSKPIGLILLFTVLGLTGQFLFKVGMSEPYAEQLVAMLGTECHNVMLGQLLGAAYALWYTIVLVCQPYIVMGLGCYALSTICWLAVLSKADLSFAYPMISIGYVAILLMDWAFFGETVTLIRWFGVLLISIGILGIYSEQRFVQAGQWFAGLIGLLSCVLALCAHSINPPPAFDKPVLLIMLAIPLGIIGQVLFKSGMNRDVNKERIRSISSNVRALVKLDFKALGSVLAQSFMLLVSPKVLLGLGAYALSTIVWLVMLTLVPLSFLYPLLSIGYVIILLIGWLGFKENVTIVRWYGVLLICYGIVMIYAEELICSNTQLFVYILAGLAGFLLTIWFKRGPLMAGAAGAAAATTSQDS